MSGLPFERLFSMGSFDALRSIRKQSSESPGQSIEKNIDLIQITDPGTKGLDFEAALQLEPMIPSEAPWNIPHDFYRSCVYSVILTHKMTWAKAIINGREKLLKQLDRDQHQCFRSARLLDSPPEDDQVVWWDTLSGHMRLVDDRTRLDRARKSEKLSWEHEKERVRKLRIQLIPKWVAVDDNTVGYDVLSYDPGPYGPINRLIEVKSTVASPLRFFVSRPEWEKALEFGAAYHFHIWNLAVNPPQLHERTVAQIQPHIPNDQKDGKWKTAEIPVGRADQ